MRGIAYIETDTGPMVLFVPGSYSTHAAWRQIQKLLVSACRMGKPIATAAWGACHASERGGS